MISAASRVARRYLQKTALEMDILQIKVAVTWTGGKVLDEESQRTEYKGRAIIEPRDGAGKDSNVKFTIVLEGDEVKSWDSTPKDPTGLWSELIAAFMRAQGPMRLPMAPPAGFGRRAQDRGLEEVRREFEGFDKRSVRGLQDLKKVVNYWMPGSELERMVYAIDRAFDDLRQVLGRR